MAAETAFYLRVDEDIELREVRAEDAEPMFTLIEASRASLEKFLPWAATSREIDGLRAFMNRYIERRARNEGLMATLWYRDELAGGIVYREIDHYSRKAEIGYWLGDAYRGKGLVTRATRALIDHAFDMMNMHRVEIVCAAGNAASRAVPERLGFVQEGVLREATLVEGQMQDVVIYGLLAREWKATPASAAADA